MKILQDTGIGFQIRCRHLSFLFCLIASAAHAQKAGYEATDLGTLPGKISSSSTAINASGQVVGGSENVNGIVHAFIYSNSTMTDLGAFTFSGPSSLTPSMAYAVNGAGIVVGASGTGIDQPAGFQSGSVIFLGTIFGNGGVGDAYGINDLNEVVGSSTSVINGFLGPIQNTPHAFLDISGTFYDLGTIGNAAAKSTAYSINNSGQIVGVSGTSAGYGYDHAFLFSNGVMTDLGTLPGYKFSAATAINASGVITGYSEDDITNIFPTRHAFIYSGGTMESIGTLPGGMYCTANAINNLGQVVGNSDNTAGTNHGFFYSQSTGMIDLNSNLSYAGSNLGSLTITNAAGINDSGQIAATGFYSSGVTHAFLLIPDPIIGAPSFPTYSNNVNVATGGTLVLDIPTSGTAPFTYQWQFNGLNVPGATSRYLILSDVVAANAGSYTLIASNSLGTVVSLPYVVNVVNATTPGRLIDISCRAQVGSGSNILISGFTIGGAGTSGSESLLIRGSGPALVPFGVTGTLADPELKLFSGSSLLASNDGWGGNAAISNAASSVGAFSWTNSASHDAAFVTSLSAGPYTCQIAGQSGDTGVALAEVYDATPATAYTLATPRLVNISTRVMVGTGANTLIAGFVVGGTTLETVLIRASGPALVPFGLTGVLPDPKLTLNNSTGTVASNTGWGGDPQIAKVAASVGAFSWGSAATPDSAILITVAPGAYTVQVSGVSGDTGIALVEVYEVR